MKVDSPPLPVPAGSSGAPDADLLRAWVRHQRQQDFTELVRRHLGMVRATACRQVGPDRADDVSQVVFSILARKAGSLGGVSSLGAWLHRVTVLHCKEVTRGEIRERRGIESARDHASLSAARDPLGEAIPLLDDAIRGLSASDQDVIHLRYSEGLPFQEVARRTGRSEVALRQQASRALAKLGDALRQRGVTVSATALAGGLGATLAGTSSASAAVMVSTAAISSMATAAGPAISWLPFLLITMSKKQCILVAAILAALLVGGSAYWVSARDKARADVEAAASGNTLRVGESSSDSPDASPSKTKTDRSRAPIPLTPEEEAARIEAAEIRKAAVMNARQIGLGLFEFESEFGSFPNEETAVAVRNATGRTEPLGAATANDALYQLVAANIMTDLPGLFSVGKKADGGERGNTKPGGVLGACDFACLFDSAGGKFGGDRPIMVAPLVNGQLVFDPSLLGGKAVVLHADNSVRTFHIERDGTVMVNGVDIFDARQPFWKGQPPVVKWPAK